MENTRAGEKRVLLADDEEAVRESLSWVLKMDRYEVVCVPDAEEALARFREETFDLVITDYSMPGMTGNELALRIRAIAPHQRILMITGYPHSLPGPDNPVDVILTKPFAINDLRNTVTSLLN